MEKMLERAIVFAYRKATALGADDIEAVETALTVLYDARPDLEETDARLTISSLLASAAESGGAAAGANGGQPRGAY